MLPGYFLSASRIFLSASRIFLSASRIFLSASRVLPDEIRRGGQFAGGVRFAARKPLMLREGRDVAVFDAAHFVALNEAVLFQGVQDGSEIHNVVRQHVQLEGAGFPAEPALAVRHGEQADVRQP